MVATFSTSNIIVELLPNPGYKEIIIETPDLTAATDQIQLTLTDYGIIATGFISASGYQMSSTYGIVIQNDPITSVIGGVLTISAKSTLITPAKRIYRVVGQSS